jgi:hypothetical protein
MVGTGTGTIDGMGVSVGVEVSLRRFLERSKIQISSLILLNIDSGQVSAQSSYQKLSQLPLQDAVHG